MEAAEGQGSPVTHRAASGSSTLSSQEEKHPQRILRNRFGKDFPFLEAKALQTLLYLLSFTGRLALPHSLLKGDVNKHPYE